MNKNSVSYINTKNQTSFYEDPFDIGLAFTQGSSMLSNQRQLELYAEQLVYDRAELINEHYELDIDKLPSQSQLELTRLYIESIDREIEWACYGEDQSINSDFLCAMLEMLKDSNPRTRRKFAQVTTINLFNYYKEALQKIIDEACDNALHVLNEASGYRFTQDKDHGDFIWSKAL